MGVKGGVTNGRETFEVQPDRVPEKKLIIQNLISLKCVLFIFFGGLGCLVPFLPLHLLSVGFSRSEAGLISIVAPFISIVGPLCVGPIADKLAGGKHAANGRYLRVMAAITMLLGALFYLLLLSVPTFSRFESRHPSVRFICNDGGGIILQEHCTEKCYHWSENKVGSLLLSDCNVRCDDQFREHQRRVQDTKTRHRPTETSVDEDVTEDIDYDVDNEAETNGSRYRRSIFTDMEDLPHLCQSPLGLDKPAMCQVYTNATKELSVEVTLQDDTNDALYDGTEEEFASNATQEENEDSIHSEEWCRYPLGNNFKCHIPPNYERWEQLKGNSSECNLVVECTINKPYESDESVLAESQCPQVIGDPYYSFWTYLILRSIADMFPVATVSLLGAATVIATRETSAGRGDVGRQLAWGSLGWAIFSPLVALIHQEAMPRDPAFLLPIVIYAVLMVIGALLLLFANGMPLSPPEWWWHTRNGMLAIPMSAVRKYGPETAALSIVLVVLGIFWSTLDTYQPWYIQDLNGTHFLQGLTLTVGAIPALPLLWYAEPLVDFCGHSNLLIAAFTMYILRYTGMAVMETPWWTLFVEGLEPITLGLTWVTAVLYMRHLVPRRLTATGQALPVIAHFCIGRCLGAIIGNIGNNELVAARSIYENMAISAAVIATVYFILYHFVLSPFCAAKPQPPPPPSVLQSMNGGGNENANGSYTPLRVYHNGRGRKGHFRY